MFFYMVLSKPLLGLLEGVGPENPDFFRPKWHLLRSLSFQGHKSLSYQGPSLPMALVIDVTRIKIIAPRTI